MYLLISESPLKYSIDGVEQNSQSHNHQACDGDCDVPFDIDYILDAGVKKSISYPENKYHIDCTDWETE